MRHPPLALPDELVALIVSHFAARRIQDQFRQHQYRHARHADFKPLRLRLVPTLSARELDELSASTQVRREWRFEPNSWVMEYDRDASLFYMLLKEVRDGLWSTT